MEICQKPCIPSCPVICKTVKKTNVPAYDALGPFPDETLLSGLDRILFLMGARRVQKFLNLPTPSADGCSSSDCSITISRCTCTDGPCCKIYADPCQRPPLSPCCKPCASVCITPKCCNSKPHSCSKMSARSVSMCDPEICPPKSKGCMQRSFSMCSLACRKLKQKICLTSPKCGPAMWLWTRVQCYEDGTQIYEVFKNSNSCSSPSQIKCQANPVIIFVVLPNGIIMPFETVTCHK